MRNVPVSLPCPSDPSTAPPSAGSHAAFLEDVLATAADWVWETDAHLRIVRVFPTSAHAGTPFPAELAGRCLDEILGWFEMEAGERDICAEALSSHAPFRNVCLRVGEGRSQRHFLLSGRPVVTERGGFAGYRGVLLETTRPYQKTLKEQEGRFRDILDYAALGIAVFPDDGPIEQANDVLSSMSGYGLSELRTMKFTDLVFLADRPAALEAARRLKSGEVDHYTLESRYARRDGSLFWGRLSVSRAAVGGCRRCVVAVLADIDDRKRAEARFSLFRAVVEASHEAVAILSPSGHILYANPAYADLFGIEMAHIQGSHYREYFPPESQAVLDRTVAARLRAGGSWEGVLDALDVASGRRFPLWQRAGVVRDDAGRVKFFFTFMHNHSAQQVFEDELYKAKEAAEEANVAKTRFLAAASHDLRQPLQALGMFVAVLAERTRETANAVLVRRIQDSVTALEGLLNSLLDVSKLEAGLVVPHRTIFPISALMERLAAEFEPLSAAQGVGFRMVASRLMVCTDRALLERILRNLLNNAVRYTGRGRILFGCRRRGQKLRIEVWDTGIGIPAAEISNIFREFHQVGNLNRDRRQGLGLGLAIVDRLGRLLDHEIQVLSQEGRGSVFSVEVPIARPEAASPLPRQLTLAIPHTGGALVVIDDEPDVLESIRLLLESWGHRVVAAVSAEEAIRRLPQLGRAPDLILADYRLQNGDTGGQAIARVEVHLRAKTKVPAIILTGDTAPERLRQAQALGHGLLHKPVQAEALRAAIDEVLSRKADTRRRARRYRRAAERRKMKAS